MCVGPKKLPGKVDLDCVFAIKRSAGSIELEGWLREDGQLHLQPRPADANTWLLGGD